MGTCVFCLKKEALPYKCKFCHIAYCGDHHLPEHHNCVGLEYWKKNRSKDPENWIYDPFRDKPRKHGKRKTKHHIKKEYVGKTKQYSKPDFSNKIKSNIKTKYYKIKYWLNKRNHRGYRNWNAFFMNLLWIMSLSLSFLIIYSNLKKLNEIVLWFLPLGGTLIIINGIYWLKYTIKLLKKIQYWFRGERYLVKYLIMLLLLFMLWQGYQQRETVFDPVMGIYNKTNFSEVLPLNLTIPWSDFNSSVAKDLDESEASTIQKILFKPPKRKEESKKALDYVNQIRHENNRQFLEWDDNLYELAVFRSEDMEKRGYFDHVTPEGKCVKDFKAHYNLSQYNIAENVGGMTHYEDGNPIPETSVNEAVDSWLTSRGHRYNLLYPSHVKGAIGCYKSICVFLGANTEYYGLGYGPCHTGDEGLSFWRSVEKQPGEL